jgi:hypothetical protein
MEVIKTQFCSWFWYPQVLRDLKTVLLIANFAYGKFDTYENQLNNITQMLVPPSKQYIQETCRNRNCLSGEQKQKTVTPTLDAFGF